jgi:hypothetical protein
LGERHRAGLAFNAKVAAGELDAPIVIARDHRPEGDAACRHEPIRFDRAEHLAISVNAFGAPLSPSSWRRHG